MEDKKTNNKKLYFILAILGTVLLLSGVSFAIFTILLQGTEKQQLIAGELLLELDESQPLNVANAIPVTDEDGLASTPFTFSIENTGTIEASYKVYIDELPLEAGQTRLDPGKIKYELKANGSRIAYGILPDDNMLLYESNIAVGININFELRLWIDWDVTTLVRTDTFSSKLRVEGSQELLPPSLDPIGEPYLVGDMIPVVYDEAQGEWVKALDSWLLEQANTGDWHDYNNQMWANAVTVTETNRQTYVDADAGYVIPMSDINAMFVWIPRYSYTIGNTYGVGGLSNSPGSVDIKWTGVDSIELGTAAYTGSDPANWYTHPAFCWGNTCDNQVTRNNSENRELTGIWIAKFESSTIGVTTSGVVQQPIIKPNVNSWINLNVANAFNSVKQSMHGDSGEGIFGLSGITYDAHVSKNTEWGAVIYLSQSKYGKYGNSSYIGVNKEVAINNCSTYITGIGGDTVNASSSTSTCTTNTYETQAGQSASTTGNIYGVYDMSGGALEYVMANMVDSSGNFYPRYSGFSTAPEAKYYNSYEYGDSNSDKTRGILGDATAELPSFYNDTEWMVSQQSPWLLRGGAYNFTSTSGIKAYYTSTGATITNYTGSFRITLVP